MDSPDGGMPIGRRAIDLLDHYSKGELRAMVRVLELDNFRLHQRAEEREEELAASLARERLLAARLAVARRATTDINDPTPPATDAEVRDAI